MYTAAFRSRCRFYWLDNIRHWCISRQLWWGHRIPAWKVVKPEQKNEHGEPVEKWYVGRTEKDASRQTTRGGSHFGCRGRTGTDGCLCHEITLQRGSNVVSQGRCVSLFFS